MTAKAQVSINIILEEDAESGLPGVAADDDLVNVIFEFEDDTVSGVLSAVEDELRTALSKCHERARA
jgi:hypothetical protein